MSAVPIRNTARSRRASATLCAVRLVIAALLVALAPARALAQTAEDIPPPPPVVDPPTAPPEASQDEPEELEAPTTEPYQPPGYRLRSAPQERAARTLVHVLSWGEDELTLHGRPRGSREPYARLCTAPCSLRVDPGVYELAISPSGGGPRGADGPPITFGRERTAVQMHYDHRSGLRVLGWTFFSLGATALGLSIGLGVWIGGWAPLIAAISGGPITAVMWIPWLVLAFLEDSARVQVDALGSARF